MLKFWNIGVLNVNFRLVMLVFLLIWVVRLNGVVMCWLVGEFCWLLVGVMLVEVIMCCMLFVM